MYPKDFDTDAGVRALDLAEIGLYLCCLNHAWVNGGLDERPEEIARALRVPVSEFDRLWPRVSKLFTPNGSGMLVNRRQEEERTEAIAKSNKAVQSGRSRKRHQIEQPENDPSEDPLSVCDQTTSVNPLSERL